jgi:putative membrane-bound dehydrogenase-like protein
MKRWRLLLSVLALCLPAAARAQVAPEKALSTFKVPEGMELSLWAGEPLFANPTCMDIDPSGRVWVCEAVNYRGQAHNRAAGDRIVILEDTKGTGKADKATVFYQAPKLQSPLGIAVSKDVKGPGYKVYVCQSPNIWVFDDKDGDGKADGPPRTLLTGFGGVNHDHGVHGILIGPDNRLYFSVGDGGVNGLQGNDRKGRRWSSNDTDCRAGTIWRCDLDGKNLELIAHNFRNEYEPCVDSFGTVFVSDNDDDGNQQTRICYVMQGGNYGYHPRGPGESHWHEEQPGVVPKILRTGFGSPAGMCVYEGKLLPEKYHGQLLHVDAGPRQLRCYHLKINGGGYDVEREDMVTSTDTWFRPIDVCVAPDGSVFIADWYDPGVGGHGMGDTKRGRIYRLAPEGNKPSVPKVDLDGKTGLIEALGSPALSVRHMAMTRIRQLSVDQARKILMEAFKKKDQPALRARAFYNLFCRSDVPFLEAATNCAGAIVEPDLPELSFLALRMIKDCHHIDPSQYEKNLIKILHGLPQQVRREVLIQLRDADPAKAKDLIMGLAMKHDGKDRFYLEAVGIAVGHHNPRRREVILADFGNQILEWDDTAADLVWELRPPSALPLLEKRLADDKLSAEQRARIVDILGLYEDKDAGKAVLVALRGSVPAEVRLKAFENLRRHLPGKWQHLAKSPELNDLIRSQLAEPESRATALTLIGLAHKTDALDTVKKLALGKDEPEAVRRTAVQTLGLLAARAAVETLQALEADKAVGVDAVRALGELSQQKSSLPTAATAEKALQDLVRRAQERTVLAQAALESLAGNYAGSKWLLDLHERKQLPQALQVEAGRLLRNSPFDPLRKRAMQAFPPQARLDPKKLPSLGVLARRQGNAEHGRFVLAASAKSDLQCLKCHSVRGSGGHIGPDLSVIGKKASKENLFESILIPSKAIADQYLTWVVETKKGLSVSGLLVEETATDILLRDANGKDTRIGKEDIDTREKSPKSIMPEDLAAYMTEADLVDLVAYLYTLKSPVLSLDSWYITGAFDGGEGGAGLDQVFPPEKEVDLKATYTGKAGKVSWRTVRPNEQGYYDLQAHYGGQSDNIISYLYREVESPADQEATILLGADDGVKLWLNGELAHTNATHRAAAPEQDRVKVKLRRGSNRLLLKIRNGDGAHGFYLAIQSEQELKAVGVPK